MEIIICSGVRLVEIFEIFDINYMTRHVHAPYICDGTHSSTHTEAGTLAAALASHVHHYSLGDNKITVARACR